MHFYIWRYKFSCIINRRFDI